MDHALLQQYVGLVSEVWEKDCTANLERDAAYIVLYFANDEETVVGGCWLQRVESMGKEKKAYFLNSLCVRESHRRKGVATTILQTILNKKKWIFLYVDKTKEKKDHDRLVAFYSRTGFREVSNPKKLSLNASVESLLVSENVPLSEAV
jgi:GNAT superfamily N-acetyltransferase